MKPHRVMIVEDEPRMRELLLRAVPQMGFEATTARSAEEALRLVEESGVDILLVDLNLPGMGGLDLLEQLRRKSPHLQAIVLTGYGDLPSAQRAIRLDAVDFLTKPCPLGDLEKSLDRARRRAEAAAEGREPAAMKFDDEPKAPAADAAHRRKLEDVEREHILAALKRHEGNRSAAAEDLGISLRTLYYRLSEYQKPGAADADDAAAAGE
ncbi:MAG: response regulator [Planctomycetota bacterium]|nr:response regulator [Planctomycetota bacterium]